MKDVMEPDVMTTDDAPTSPTSGSTSGERSDPVLSDAHFVLDKLLDMVRGRAEDIVDTARGEAEVLSNAAREQAASQRIDLLGAAEREAAGIVQQARESAARQMSSVLAIVEACIGELGRIETYRSNLESLATQLRDAVEGIGPAGPEAPASPGSYVEVHPEALQMLAGELGPNACRDVIDTFVFEMSGQLEDLAVAVESGDVKTKKKVVRILHNMSSGCSTVGAAALADLCHRVTPETLSENLDQIVRRGNIVRAEVIRVRDRDLMGGNTTVYVGKDTP